MSEALNPCPFCGKQPEIVTQDVEPQNDYWYSGKRETFVLCQCGACLFDGTFHEGFWDAETRAVAAWNQRATPVAAVEPSDEQMETILQSRHFRAGYRRTESDKMLIDWWKLGFRDAILALRQSDDISDEQIDEACSNISRADYPIVLRYDRAIARAVLALRQGTAK